MINSNGCLKYRILYLVKCSYQEVSTSLTESHYIPEYLRVVISPQMTPRPTSFVASVVDELVRKRTEMTYRSIWSL